MAETKINAHLTLHEADLTSFGGYAARKTRVGYNKRGIRSKNREEGGGPSGAEAFSGQCFSNLLVVVPLLPQSLDPGLHGLEIGQILLPVEGRLGADD